MNNFTVYCPYVDCDSDQISIELKESTTAGYFLIDLNHFSASIKCGKCGRNSVIHWTYSLGDQTTP